MSRTTVRATKPIGASLFPRGGGVVVFRRAILSCAIALFMAPFGQALAQVDFATGLNSQGVLQTAGDSVDANWQVTGAVNPLNPPTAYVVGPTSADEGFCCGWPANGPNSSWIAANPDDAYGNGYMTFTQRFWVADPTTVAIHYGEWSIDDQGTLSLNGHVLSTLGTLGWLSMHPFSTVSGDFVQGWNTLVMTVTYSDIGVDGARLEGALVTFPSSAVPEPSTWTMLLIGFAGLGFAGYVQSTKRRLAVSGGDGASY